MEANERMMVLEVVLDALARGSVAEAEALYRSIPDCADVPRLPSVEQLEKARHIRRASQDRRMLEASESLDFYTSHKAEAHTADAMRAELLEHAEMAKFPCLIKKATGERVDAKRVKTVHGWAWRVGNTFYSVGTAHNDKPNVKRSKAGYIEGEEWATAEIKWEGEGYGNSGRAWLATVRTDGK